MKISRLYTRIYIVLRLLALFLFLFGAIFEHNGSGLSRLYFLAALICLFMMGIINSSYIRCTKCRNPKIPKKWNSKDKILCSKCNEEIIYDDM